MFHFLFCLLLVSSVHGGFTFSLKSMTTTTTTTQLPMGSTTTASKTPKSVLCVPCAKGTFKPLGGLMAECTTNCTAPGMCESTHKECIPCPVGHFADQEGQTECKHCRNGTVSDVKGAQRCNVECPEGHTNNNEWTKCIKCWPGTFNAKNGSICANCKRGEFTDKYEALECSPCPLGSYGASTGLAKCMPCGKGNFGILSGASSQSSGCRSCLGGYYCPHEYTNTMLECERDTYCPPGSKSALPCPLLYGSPAKAEHCSPTSAFYGVIGASVVLIIVFILVLAVRSVRKREKMLEKQTLLPANSPSKPTLVYQGL